ncbi:hypothetical protein KFK09_028177 [Dendrobium nobile]|uniref:DUF4005 domain-containing protein n=1 Tax=Dendrobium nobile TaxID=94219 RepID=A0A8T3A1U5_DENNO|nr:hypothetical protein KFK09_028177 [Dendrobium nobile]
MLLGTILKARRALRALKGLVKLQALVRGNIVRKQAAETLRCMNALVRVQAKACACRALHSKTSSSSKSSHSNPGPATPEKYEAAIRSIAWKRNSLKKTRGTDVIFRERNQSANSDWFYQCTEERYWNLSKAFKQPIDNEKLRFYSKQKNCVCHIQSSCCSVKSNYSARSLATEPKSLSTPNSSSLDPHQLSSGESAQYYSAASQHVNSRKGPFTPVKTECSRSLFKVYSNYANYMANTESSMAKSRSQSAPRQRPDYEKTKALRRLSTQAKAASVQRSSKFANVAYSGSGRLDILEMPMCM